MRKKEIKNEIDEIKKWEQKIKRRDLKYDQKKKKKKIDIWFSAIWKDKIFWE